MLIDGKRLLIATHNPGKLREFEFLLAPHGIGVEGAAALGLPEPAETGATFAENALLKARAAAEATGLPALADDSGLVVYGLGGEPGIHSARWAGPARDFELAIRKVLDGLRRRFGSFAAADKRAAFVAVLCLCHPDGRHRFFEGRVEGTLVDTPRGARGFGYDPIFVPDGFEKTFAEMTAEEKHAISHRRLALDAFVAAIEQD
ncbi:RdgB/HAM1 family non-canonical purine NTP pyrophosphatase [Benzoatithermus flavus]|uniref:dITP/XTP pyrophosphatase n=1 Tax=Benzoatithermus flavus TaxID=3108223 RepID=A0ABU8XSM0_9PROT